MELPFRHACDHIHHVYIRANVQEILVCIFVEMPTLHQDRNKYLPHEVHLVDTLRYVVDHSIICQIPAMDLLSQNIFEIL